MRCARVLCCAPLPTRPWNAPPQPAKTAPYGSWKSPITSDLIVAQSICAVGRAARRRQRPLARRPAAGAGPQCRGARRRAHGADRPHAAAVQRAHPRARIWRRVVDGDGRRCLFLQFRRWPALSAGAGRRAAAADPGAARARARLALRRRGHRSLAASAGSACARITPSTASPSTPSSPSLSTPRERGRRPGAFWPADMISTRRRGCRRTAAGSPGWRGIIPTCRGTAPCSTSPNSAMTVGSVEPQLIAAGRRESIFQPEWSPDGGAHRVRVGPLRLVESLPLRARNANDAAAGADGGGVRPAAMGVRPLDLCLRRARPDRLCLFRRRARPTGGAGPDQRNADPRSTCRSPSSARCAPMATAWCFAPARRIIPPASSRSTSRPAGTRSSRKRPTCSIARSRALPTISPGSKASSSRPRAATPPSVCSTRPPIPTTRRRRGSGRRCW